MNQQPEHSSPHRSHTNPILVFGILTIATIFEVVVTLFNLPKEVIVPLLVAIAFVKAGLVAAYYMHLRYERKILTWIFLLPAIAVGILTVIMQFFVT